MLAVGSRKSADGEVAIDFPLSNKMPSLFEENNLQEKG